MAPNETWINFRLRSRSGVTSGLKGQGSRTLLGLILRPIYVGEGGGHLRFEFNW